MQERKKVENEKNKENETNFAKSLSKDRFAWFTSKRLFIIGGALGLILLGVLVFHTFVYETK